MHRIAPRRTDPFPSDALMIAGLPTLAYRTPTGHPRMAALGLPIRDLGASTADLSSRRLDAKRKQRVDVALQPASPSYIGEAEYEPDDRHDAGECQQRPGATGPRLNEADQNDPE